MARPTTSEISPLLIVSDIELDPGATSLRMDGL
jgi:hypothetical protein